MVEPRRKSCDSPGMMVMGGNLSSQEVDWRWNHGDPTVELLENTSGSHDGLPPNTPHRRSTTRHPAPPLQASIFRFPLVMMSRRVHSINAERSFKHRWSWVLLLEGKKKQKKKRVRIRHTGKERERDRHWLLMLWPMGTLFSLKSDWPTSFN